MEINNNFSTFLTSITAFVETMLPKLETNTIQSRNETLSSQSMFPNNDNMKLPIIGIILVLIPLWIPIVMTMASAWAWIFWLLTSILVGLMQSIYATYQFIIISFDVSVLTIMNMFKIFWNRCLLIINNKSGGLIRENKEKRWREQLETATTYEDFIKLMNKSKRNELVQSSPQREPSYQIDEDCLPRKIYNLKPSKQKSLRRSSSFSVGDHATVFAELEQEYTDEDESSSPARRSSKLVRNKSFSGKVSTGSEQDPVVVKELGQKMADLLSTTTSRLKDALLYAKDHPQDLKGAAALKYLLAGVMKRNHLNVEDLIVENARSIHDSGKEGLSTQSRQLIQDYYQEIEKSLHWIGEAPMIQRVPSDNIYGDAGTDDLTERISLVGKMKHNIGRTALMLSGGGAIAMYHIGVIKALIEANLYDGVEVVSGSSGGSIIAATCAVHTPEELMKYVCVPTVATDYTLTGEQKRKNIQWFPSPWEMAKHWMKDKTLMDTEFFERTCEFYFKDITFEEAYMHTGKHVCITVSASRPSSNTVQRLLLNHISTPHVTVASAVRASCGLPGLMKPAKLMAKNSNGKLEPFEVDGVEWIDGSVQADLPFERISTLFSVTNFIVSQTNFFVIPFMNNKMNHSCIKSSFWGLFKTIEWDIRDRALSLSRLGLFPKLFGQDVSRIFEQKYTGNLTIVPRFTTMQTLGLKALSNPTLEDMKAYIKFGQIAIWPFLDAIHDMVRLEKALDKCLARLEDRLQSLSPEFFYNQDEDFGSIASNSAATLTSSNRRGVRIVGYLPPSLAGNGSISSYRKDREADRLRKLVIKLEKENQKLRQEITTSHTTSFVDSDNHGNDGENVIDITSNKKDIELEAAADLTYTSYSPRTIFDASDNYSVSDFFIGDECD